MELTSGLVCRQLTFRWPKRDSAVPPVLDEVEAHFPTGAITLVTGKTGAGKSTLLHLLAGLLRPASGEVRADGEPVSRWRTDHLDRWRRNVGIVFQHLAVVSDLSAGENVLLPLIPRGIGWLQMEHDVGRELGEAGLADLIHTPASELSGGQRQRLAIARALVIRPRFILADEPTAFQDNEMTRRIISRLADAARQGAVVVISSHDPRLRESGAIGRRFHLTEGKLTPTDSGENNP